MKRIIYLFIFLMVILMPTVSGDMYDSVLTEDVKNKIHNSFDILNSNSETDINALELINRLNKGDFNVEFTNIIEKVKYTFYNAVKENITGFTRILVIILLSSVVDKINFVSKDKNIAHFVSGALVLLVIIEAFLGISDVAIKVIESLTVFLNSLVPVLLTITATGGKIITAKLLNPIVLVASSIVSLIIKSLIIPFSLISLSLKFTYSATGKENVMFISKQISTFIKWLIGFILTVYMGLVTIGGTVAVNIDGTLLKTAKFAVGSFVPYVGSMLSDSVELVLNGALVVKNSLGVVGLIGIISAIVFPCIFLVVKVLFFKLIHIVATPICNKNVFIALEGASDCVSVMLGMVLVVAVMYILSITVIIGVGGA